MSTKNHAPLLIAVAVGTAGGIARYLDDVLNHGRRFALAAFVAAVFVAAFFGWLVAEVATAFGHPGLAYAAAGVGGFMGTQSLDFALGIVRQRLTGKKES